MLPERSEEFFDQRACPFQYRKVECDLDDGIDVRLGRVSQDVVHLLRECPQQLVCILLDENEFQEKKKNKKKGKIKEEGALAHSFDGFVDVG